MNISYKSLFILLFSANVYADDTLKPAITTPFSVSDILQYENDPPKVQKLIADAADLTKQNLTYLYGSSNPRNKGMDCSGTIYYLLTANHLKNVPRSSEDMYMWVKNNKTLHMITSNDFNSAEFSHLKPGDLLFWSGTYKTIKSVTHVMMYLGLNKNHQPIMFGSSDGRIYQNKKMWGVSVFDFKLPDKNTSVKFEGYSCIPQLTCPD